MFTTLIVRTHARCYRYCYENGTYTVRRRARLFKEVIVTVPHHPPPPYRDSRAMRRASASKPRRSMESAPVASFAASDDTLDAQRRRAETEQKRADVFKRLDDHVDRALKKVRRRGRGRARKSRDGGVIARDDGGVATRETRDSLAGNEH